MRVVLISGLSGAGKSTAIRALEDLSFYCIDNLPVPLLPSFLNLASWPSTEVKNFAIVIDARDQANIAQLPEAIRQCTVGGSKIEVLFLEASEKILAQRYSETRRRHHLSPDESPLKGIQEEKKILADVRTMAHHILDTSELNVHELKEKVKKIFYGEQAEKGLAVTITSFGFKHGLPLNADLVFDVRFLPNPFFVAHLKEKTGRSEDVKDYVLDQDGAKEVIAEFDRLLKFLLPKFEKEGKSYLTVAVGCTGGQHRSVVVASELKKSVQGQGYLTNLQHRDIPK